MGVSGVWTCVVGKKVWENKERKKEREGRKEKNKKDLRRVWCKVHFKIVYWKLSYNLFIILIMWYNNWELSLITWNVIKKNVMTNGN